MYLLLLFLQLSILSLHLAFGSYLFLGMANRATVITSSATARRPLGTGRQSTVGGWLFTLLSQPAAFSSLQQSLSAVSYFLLLCHGLMDGPHRAYSLSRYWSHRETWKIERLRKLGKRTKMRQQKIGGPMELEKEDSEMACSAILPTNTTFIPSVWVG